MPQPPRTRQTLPGLTGVDHIGFTVPDLEQARTFLVDVLGCEYMYSLVHPRAVMQQLHFFRCGGQAIFEVFEYSAPDQDPEQPRNSDIGGHHVALYVDDLDAAVAFLHEQGLTVLGDPTASKGPSEGQRWIYFLSPWGMQFELVSYPGGKAYDRQRAAQAVPANPPR